MWDRTKRLVNSYLDNLIDRVEKPDLEVRDLTRAEIARLNDVEAQSRASAKMLEKELAELELKMTGTAERARIASEMGNVSMQASAASELASLQQQRDLVRQQMAEAISYAEKARTLRSERQTQGEQLATDTHLTRMQETLAGVQSPFSANDPSGVIDEMRAKISRNRGLQPDLNVADADRELEKHTKAVQVDDLLARYKSQSSEDFSTSVSPQAIPDPPAAGSQTETKSDDPAQDKTLGPAKGPIRPID
jgi:phage shock protein A